MTDDVPPTPTTKPPASFGGLAKTVRSRTTDLLAIAVILVGGLAVGGKVSQWWQTDDARSDRPGNANPKTDFPNGEPVELDFGHSPYSLNRRILVGKRKSALQQLTGLCGEVAENRPLPDQPANLAEKQLLASLSGEKPVQVIGNRRVYLKDGPVPLAVVADGAEGSQRVVCWGLAFPSGENRWTAYAFHAADRGQNAKSVSPVTIPLPPDAGSLLTIRGRGNSWQTFRSKQTAADGRLFYEAWFTSHGWTEKTSSASNTGWAAVYIKKTDKGFLRTELQISQTSPATSAGVAFIQNIDK